MSTDSKPPAGPGGVVDALEQWDAEAATTAAALSVIRLDGSECLVTPFTTSMKRVAVHYLDTGSLRGYVHCNGPGCVLCRVGRHKDTRDLWPVNDLVNRSVGVLPISPNMRPQALRPQLLPVLRRMKDSETPLLVSIRRDEHRYTMNMSDLPEDADHGDATVRDFLRRLDAGEIDLGSVYPRYADADLAAIPEVARLMAAKGVKL
jgi:hypothetical protein